MVLVFVALPETSRVVVGNGSIPASGIYRCLLPIPAEQTKIERPSNEELPHRKFTLPNPVDCLKILLLGDVAIILLCNGIYYMLYCCAQASLSTLFIDIYGYHDLEAGLIYIPFGVACLLSTFLWGRIHTHPLARFFV